MHLLVELLFPLLFTLTRVFLAVWTDLPTLSPSILCKEIWHTAMNEPYLSRVKRGRRKEMMGKSKFPEDFLNIFAFTILAPPLSTASSTYTENLVSLHPISVSSEFGLRFCLTRSADTLAHEQLDQATHMPLQKKASLSYTESPRSTNVSTFGRKWSNIVISEGRKTHYSNETVSLVCSSQQVTCQLLPNR